MNEKKSENLISKKTHAYTSGIKVKWKTTVRKERKLPIEGDVLTNLGSKVSYDTILANTNLPGDPYFINIAAELRVPPKEINRYLTKDISDPVEKGEVLAKWDSFFGLIKKSFSSPISGIIESISEKTGRIIIRGKSIPVSINAYITGEVIKIMPREGAVIETEAAYIQGIFGIGGERHGKLRFIVNSPDEVPDINSIYETNKGCILVAGSCISIEMLKKAVEIGAAGIIVGGINPFDLYELLGEEIGVAITGEEEVGLTLITTEGFGKMSMAKRTFNVLKHFEGYIASINGATQIRAGVQRPEIIIPHHEVLKQTKTDELSHGLIIGTPVRVIREPHFGSIGKVVSLPIKLQKIKTESSVRVLDIILDDGGVVRIPRANVEIMEE